MNRVGGDVATVFAVARAESLQVARERTVTFVSLYLDDGFQCRLVRLPVLPESSL